jgi:hypothetical protein
MAGVALTSLFNPWLTIESLQRCYSYSVGNEAWNWCWVVAVVGTFLALIQAIAARPLVLAERLAEPERVREEKGGK